MSDLTVSLDPTRPSDRDRWAREEGNVETLVPLLDGELSSIPANFEVYLPLRVAEVQTSNGSIHAYLRDGTAFVVNSRDVLRLTTAVEDIG
jgi:hypothetical protein